MKERIAIIMDRENLSPTKLAEILKIQPSNVSHLLSGRNKPSFELMGKVFEAFPHISADWFITGKGEYLKSIDTNSTSNKPQSLFNDKMFVTSVNATESTIDTDNSNRTAPSPQEFSKEIEIPQNLISKASRIVVFYDDNTFEEFIPRKR